MRFILPLGFILLLFGCDNGRGGDVSSRVPVFKADVRAFFSSEERGVSDSLLFSTGRVLFFETTPKSLLGNIAKVFSYEDRVAVYDDQDSKICVFDTIGRFLFSIDRKGRGPGEYLKITDCCYDYAKHQFLIYTSTPSKFMRFDNAGNFISEVSEEGLYNRFALVDDQLVCIDLRAKHGDDFVVRLSNVDRTIGNKQQLHIPLIDLYPIYPLGTQVHSSKNELYLARRFDRTIYRYEKDTLIPYCRIDFGAYNLPESFQKGQLLSEQEFAEQVREPHYITGLSNIKVCREKLYFMVNSNGFCVIDLRTHEVQSVSMVVDHQTQMQCNYFLPTQDADNKYLAFSPAISHASMKIYVNHVAKGVAPWFRKKIDAMTDEDNPFILLYEVQ